MSDSYDSPWKEMLEHNFPLFMAFFFPHAFADIDWQRGYESLDHELPQIQPKSDIGGRIADKLVRAWRLSGEPLMVLIHIEIQRKREKGFPRRMYVYNYRAFDRYDVPVASLAVLCDTSPSWRPDHWGYELWGCRASLHFPVAKVEDYNARWAELEASDNPFATVVMAHLKASATHNDPSARYRWKRRLIRRLYERDSKRKEVVELFRFIDWVMKLPEELASKLRVDIATYEAEVNMPYITSIERMGIEQGLQQGLQQGIEKGIEKGHREGLRAGEASILRRLLGLRFAPLPDWAEQRLEAASRDELESWAERVLEAESLEAVFAA